MMYRFYMNIIFLHVLSAYKKPDKSYMYVCMYMYIPVNKKKKQKDEKNRWLEYVTKHDQYESGGRGGWCVTWEARGC